MCLQTYIYIEPQNHEKIAPRSPFRASSMILLSVLLMLAGSLFAQGGAEDYAALLKWELPPAAVPMSDLRLEAKILMQDSQPFEGWAYELYPEGTLRAAVEYKKGQENGFSLMWYPDGKPQMSANYRQGALHGRFLGWYQNGGVIYDRYINLGKYASDNLVDKDQDRLRDETEIIEREGNTDDGTRE